MKSSPYLATIFLPHAVLLVVVFKRAQICRVSARIINLLSYDSIRLFERPSPEPLPVLLSKAAVPPIGVRFMPQLLQA